MAVEEEYEGGPDRLEEKMAGLDEELAESRAAALRASLADYDLDDDDAELLAGFTAGGEIVEVHVGHRAHIEGGQALLDLAQQAGETMDEIATEVLRMTKLMREIANASLEQSHGIEQVNIAVNQMDETAQQNAALVQQSSAATRSLEEQSRELMEAMSSFKLTAQAVA